MTAPVFDPNKPFNVVEPAKAEKVAEPQEAAPKFDPSKPFNVVVDKAAAGVSDPQAAYAPTQLTPQEEEQFQSFMASNPDVLKWKSDFEEEYGSSPNIDDSNYDYRGAWKAGIVPQATQPGDVPHWGSIGVAGKQLKSPDHPTRWKSEYMELTGIDPDTKKIDKADAIKAMKQQGLPVEHLILSSELEDPEIKAALDTMAAVDPDKLDEEVGQIIESENKFNNLPQMSKKDKSTYFDDFFERLGAGGIQFARSLFRVPALIQDIRNFPQRALEDYVISKGVEEGSITKEEARQISQTLREAEPGYEFERFLKEDVAENAATRYLEKHANKLREASARYDQSIESYLKQGEYSKALGAAGLGAGESLVPTLLAAFTGGTGLATLGLSAAAEKKAELDKVSDTAESVKTANAVLTGSFEVITEKIGSAQLGGLIKTMYKKAGKDAAEKALRDGFIANMKKYYQKIGIYTAPVQEGLSEAANQFLQNVTDIVTGVSPDLNPLSGVVDAFAIGTVTGTGFQAAAVPSMVAGEIQKRKARNHEDMLDEIMQKREQQPPERFEEAPEQLEVEPLTEQQVAETEKLNRLLDEMSQAGIDVTDIPIEEVESRYEQFKAEQDAKEQPREPVRPEGEPQPVEEVRDPDLPEVDRPELPDRPEAEKTEAQVVEEVIRESKDPVEIATTYLAEKEKPAEIDAKDIAIRDNLTKVTQESFENFGDPADLKGPEAISKRAYFSEGGQEIDQVVKDINDLGGVQVTTDDIVDFMTRFPGGAKDLPVEGGRSRELAKAYKDLTGKALTEKSARKLLEKEVEPVEEDPEAVEELFGPTTEETDVSFYAGANEVENVPIPEDKIPEGPQDHTPKRDKLNTPEVKEEQVTKDLDQSPIEDLPPERRADEADKISNNIVLNKTIEKLQKALPGINVVTDPTEFKRRAYTEFKGAKAPPAFVSKGEVFLDPTRTSKEGAIEEFAHLWINLAKETNTSVYNKGLELIDDTPYLKKAQQLYPDIPLEMQREEALARAIADKGAQTLNKGLFNRFASSLGNVINKPLRKAGFVKKVNLYEDNLESFTQKASKELLAEIPITKLTSKEFDQIKNKVLKGEATVQASLLNGDNWASQATSWGKRLFSDNVGAGEKLLTKKNRVKFAINAYQKQAEFIVKDLDEALSNYAKGLKGTKEEKRKALEDALSKIQNALTNKGESKDRNRLKHLDLPDDVTTAVRRMRIMVDRLTSKLQHEGVLIDEDLRTILNKNLGSYLNRSYAKHVVQNYDKKFKNYMTEKQYTDVVNFLKKKYEDKSIKSIKFSKVKDGISYVFTNNAGLRSKPVLIKDIDQLKGIFHGNTRNKIKELIESDLKEGTYDLTTPTGAQNLINFRVTTEQINDVIIKSIVGDDGIVSKIALGRPMDDMGIGSLETSVLKKRGEIEEPIRVLLGEFVDPRVNFMNSVFKMASLLEKGKFENDLFKAGRNTFFTTERTASNTKAVTKEDTRTLAGKGPFGVGEKTYYTTPEIYELLYAKPKTFESPTMQSLIMLNGLTKAALTIGKDDSQARNFWGAALNLTATGRLPFYLGTAAQVSFADATKAQQVMSLMSTPLAVTLGSAIAINNAKGKKKKTRDYIRELHVDAVRYGLIGEALDTGIIQDLINSVESAKNPNSLFEKVKSAQKKHFELFSKPYQATDEMFKFSQWVQEINDFKKIYPDKTLEEIKAITAEKVRRMQPTYSLSSAALKALSKTPAAGSFVMFTAQMWKTRMAIIKEAAAEIKEGQRTNNPKLKRLGQKRIAGLLLSSLAIPAAAATLKYRMGWDDDEDKALARLLPSYETNNSRFYFSSDKKNPVYMDLAFIDPSSQFHKMAIAAMRGEDLSEKFGDFLKEGYDPFLSPEIFTQRLIELSQNRDQYGRAIAQEHYSDARKIGAKMWHGLEMLLPGYSKTAVNLYKGAIGYQTDYGKVYNLTNELLNSRVGVKTKKRNVAKIAKSRFLNFYSTMNEARKEYKKTIGKKDDPFALYSSEELLEQANRANAEAFEEIQKDVDALITLGYSKKEIEEIITGIKLIPKYIRKQILKGKFEGIDKKDGNYKKGIVQIKLDI